MRPVPQFVQVPTPTPLLDQLDGRRQGRPDLGLHVDVGGLV
jgi:hypothetical protein